LQRIATLFGVASAPVFLLAALVLGGCATQFAAVILPAAPMGDEYYGGYMAGTRYIEDGYDGVGPSARWFKSYSLTETDAAIQRALMSLPPDVVENHSLVWIEAFRAGATSRFDQIRAYSNKRAMPARVGIVVALLVAAGLVSAARAGTL
jgi:hypothetical protein